MGTHFDLEGPNGGPVTLPLSGGLIIGGGDVRFWIHGTFAPHWFADAVEEARKGPGAHPRRREIAAALAAAEAYLLEWVRDEMVRKPAELDAYFPPDRKTFDNAVERWANVCQQLRKDGKLNRDLDRSGGGYWPDFHKLKDYRNALVHGGAGRPREAGQSRASDPCITPGELESLPSGWAVNVVRRLVEDAHAAAGTTPPPWLGSGEPLVE